VVSERAPDRRPDVVLLDVFGTLLRLDALAVRFTELGRPEHEFDLFFARVLRDGMAFSLAGSAPPFADVATNQLRITSGLDEEAISYVLAGFSELPAQPDAHAAIEALRGAEIPCYAFTHGSPEIAEGSLGYAGLRDRLDGVLSAQSIHSFKPPARVYEWACEQVGSPRERTALVAVHSWDTHGAACAGLLAGLATRLEGLVPEIIEPPHVAAHGLDEVAAGLLAL
jgi:2-haloacid dehalogenase